MACQDEWSEIQVKLDSWRLPAVYSDIKYLATGAFGTVCVAFDTKLKSKVVIKRCVMVFLTIDKALSVYREMVLLSHFKHTNIVKMLNVFIPPSPEAESDATLGIYLVLEFCDKTLAHIIESQQLTEDQIRNILSQTLQALAYIHAAGIVHRDINPHNIMINNNGVVKIIDFGLACLVCEVTTAYVSTWWNTAPEIVLSLPADQRVDIWSAGCVLFQMIARCPLFSSTNKSHVLSLMMNTFEIESLDWVENISDKRLYETAKEYTGKSKKGFGKLIDDSSSKNMISCLENLLIFDHKLRPSAEQALAHPFINDSTASAVHPPSLNTESADSPLSPDLPNTPIEGLRKLVFEFIATSTSFDK